MRTPGPDVAAFALSGGNQQKLIVGREMMADPTVLIAAHPTRGIDVGAQAAVWDVLREARGSGLAVLLVSADLDELIGLSDTLLVMFRGELVATLDPAHGHPGRARLVHDRRPRRHGGTRVKQQLRTSSTPWPHRSSPRSPPSLVSSIALLAGGHSPIDAFQTMWQYVDSADSVVAIINRAVPYYVAGRRRRHRVQDEPVQHRRRRPVPAGRAAGRGGRRAPSTCRRPSTSGSSSSSPSSSAPPTPPSPAC